MENKNLKPVVRFPEFIDDWKSNILGKQENINFLKGKGISKADIVDEGKTQCIRYGELYTIYDEVIDKVYSKTNLPTSELVLSKANDVIIPASGETQIDIATASCVLRDDIALSGDLNIIRSEINGVFLSYYLNNKKKKAIARLSQGSSVIHLYNPHLKTLKLNLPIPDEQKKIANFLTSIDARINVLKEKKDTLLDFKKGVLQKIFNQDIRFKDDNGNDFPDWKEDDFKKLTKINQGLQIAISERYSSPIENGYFYITNEFLKGNSLSYYILNPPESVKCDEDDVLMTRTGNTGQVVTGVKGAFHNNFFKINFDRSQINKDFLVYFLKFYTTQCSILRLAGTSTIPDLNHSDFYRLKLNYPKLEEQNKIVNYLTALDNKIEAIQQKIDASIDYKKGLLQKMFV